MTKTKGRWGNIETQRHGKWSSGRGAVQGLDPRCRLAHCTLTGAHSVLHCGIIHLIVDGSSSDCLCGAIRIYCPNGGSRIVTDDA